MKKYNLIWLLVLSIFFSCQRDDEPYQFSPNLTDFSQNFGSSAIHDFMGRVVNENNEALEGVAISVGGLTTLTDANGVFSIKDASVYEKFAYIKASKAGYINGSRSLLPSDGVNQIEIMLLAEDIVATVNTGEASQVSLPNGTQVNFRGDFVKADGTAYSGAVSVIMKHLDPMDENVEQMMPGMLYAQDTNGNAKVLETYGMIAVELKSASGEELQIATGSPAQIELPVPSLGLANAPDTIPLWHFDEEEGYWKEEGFANLVNGKYIGEVTHFSFWNCDVQLPLVELCITVVDPTGNPLANEFFTLNRLSTPSGWGANAYSYTNENGVACGLVPIDEELIFIMDVNDCPTSFEVNIGSFNTDSSITVVVDANYNIVQLVGNFNDCDNNPVTNGYIQFIHNDGVQYIPVYDGIINYTYAYCSSVGGSFSAQGIDMGGQQTTTIISGTLSTTTDLGTITSCGTFEDTDGDGVFDEFEDVNQDNNLDNDDTDGDGIPNYNDTDDDGDGVLTADEDIDGDGNFTNDDTDGDGIPNYLDAYDVNIYNEIISECANTGSAEADFDLVSQTASIIGNQTDVSIAFYLTETDAQNETGALSSPYTSTSVTIFVRIDHDTLPYFLISPYILNVETCNLNQPQEYYYCEDTQGSGMSCMIYLDQTNYILNGNTGVVSYHLSQADADSNANPITNISSYCNTNPYQESIFIRVEVNGNVTIMSTWIVINPLPEIYGHTTNCDVGNATYSIEMDYSGNPTTVISSEGTATINYSIGVITVTGITVGNDVVIDLIDDTCTNPTASTYTVQSPTCN